MDKNTVLVGIGTYIFLLYVAQQYQTLILYITPGNNTLRFIFINIDSCICKFLSTSILKVHR